MSKEKVDPRTLEALSENFKKWGWDEKVPRTIHDSFEWEEFHCTDESFGFEIKNKDGKITKVDLLIAAFPLQPHFEPLRLISIRWGWEGNNLEIRAFPVTKIICTDPELMAGEKEEAITIVAPWEKFAYTITGSGRLLMG